VVPAQKKMVKFNKAIKNPNIKVSKRKGRGFSTPERKGTR